MCPAEVRAFWLECALGALSTKGSVNWGTAPLTGGSGAGDWDHCGWEKVGPPAATGLALGTPGTSWHCGSPKVVVTCSCFAAKHAETQQGWEQGGKQARLGLGRPRVHHPKRGQLLPSQCVWGHAYVTAGPTGVFMAVGVVLSSAQRVDLHPDLE